MANNFKNAVKTNIAIDSGTYTTVYAAPAAKVSIILECDIANTTAAAIDASVTITDNSASTTSYIVKDAPIPAGGALKVISGQKIVLEALDSIKAAASAGSSADCIVSILEDVG